MRTIASFRKAMLVIVIGFAISLIFTSNSISKIEAGSIPNFGLPYYLIQNPCMHWGGGPHQWNHSPNVTFMDPGQGSGIDFGCAGSDGQPTSFQVAAIADGDVIWADPKSLDGNLGIQVAVKSAHGLVIRYGHLNSILPEIVDALNARHPYHVKQGGTVGFSGNTGLSAGSAIHLHLELRDGSKLCCAGSDTGGNAISWDGIKISDYTIHSYKTSSGIEYNYDGVAVREQALPSNLGPIIWRKFSYIDNGVLQTNVWTWLPAGYQCDNNSDCESTINTINSRYYPYVKFAGKGKFVGGGQLISTQAMPIAHPKPKSNPTPTLLVPTFTPVHVCGSSPASLYVDVNYFCGTQYGWSSTGGWVNTPNYMDNQASSIKLDSGYSLIVAQDPDGAGGKKCFITSEPNLANGYYDNGVNVNDSISSVWIYNDSTCGGNFAGTRPGDMVTIWVDPNFTNTNYGWHDPLVLDTPDYLSNNASSIGITQGWSILVYENVGQQGGVACFNSSDPDLSDNYFNNGHTINDNIESIQTFHDSICGGMNP